MMKTRVKGMKVIASLIGTDLLPAAGRLPTAYGGTSTSWKQIKVKGMKVNASLANIDILPAAGRLP